MYEYVKRDEYQPVREELETIIHNVQKIMKRFNITFQYRLIGSGKRHLITRVKGGNGGFDFDYNLILQAPEKGYRYDPNVIKDKFREAFNEAVKGTGYKAPEDSTSAITIKVVNQRKKKILYSCDFAIIYYPNEDCDNRYFYLKNWKDGKYSFEMRLLKDAEWKRSQIVKYGNGWQAIRDEYLKLKNNNSDPNKHSFVLYLESIHNVYNHIQQLEESSEDDDWD